MDHVLSSSALSSSSPLRDRITRIDRLKELILNHKHSSIRIEECILCSFCVKNLKRYVETEFIETQQQFDEINHMIASLNKIEDRTSSYNSLGESIEGSLLMSMSSNEMSQVKENDKYNELQNLESELAENQSALNREVEDIAQIDFRMDKIDEDIHNVLQAIDSASRELNYLSLGIVQSAITSTIPSNSFGNMGPLFDEFVLEEHCSVLINGHNLQYYDDNSEQGGLDREGPEKESEETREETRTATRTAKWKEINTAWSSYVTLLVCLRQRDNLGDLIDLELDLGDLLDITNRKRSKHSSCRKRSMRLRPLCGRTMILLSSSSRGKDSSDIMMMPGSTISRSSSRSSSIGLHTIHETQDNRHEETNIGEEEEILFLEGGGGGHKLNSYSDRDSDRELHRCILLIAIATIVTAFELFSLTLSQKGERHKAQGQSKSLGRTFTSSSSSTSSRIDESAAFLHIFEGRPCLLTLVKAMLYGGIDEVVALRDWRDYRRVWSGPAGIDRREVFSSLIFDLCFILRRMS